ncbi:MAG: LysR family transcriptional regulator [Pseudomonadota bacterium]
MDRLTEMQAFATVVDQGGFTGAARKLDISKSAVSKHVSSLETRLGVRLLNRTTRRVNPTEIGLIYYERAQLVLEAAREADGMVGALQSEPEGQLRVAVTPAFGEAYIAPKLGAFLGRFQSVSVDLVFLDRPVELNSEGFDVAIAPGNPAFDTTQNRVITSYRMELVASPAYLKTQGAPSRVEDLAMHDLLQSSGSSADGAWRLKSHTGEIRTIRGRARAQVNKDISIADLAKEGAGIAWLPSFVVDEALHAGRLSRVLEGLPEQIRYMIASTSQSSQMMPKVTAFLDHIGVNVSTPKNSPVQA